MRRLRNIADGLRGLFGRTRVESEMDEELSGFLDAAAQERMRRGMNDADAMRAARAEMGSTESVKQKVRASGWESSAEFLWQDVRYGIRQLRRAWLTPDDVLNTRSAKDFLATLRPRP